MNSYLKVVVLVALLVLFSILSVSVIERRFITPILSQMNHDYGKDVLGDQPVSKDDTNIYHRDDDNNDDDDENDDDNEEDDEWLEDQDENEAEQKHRDDVSWTLPDNDSPSMLDIKHFRETRDEQFDSWFDEEGLYPDADKNGPILDFAITGFPKCGTTSMEANLGYLAPMPIGDVNVPIHNTVWYAYKNWPTQFNNTNNILNETKILRGTKGPQIVSSNYLRLKYSVYLPKTVLIVGIRHPILMFQSFWNMQSDYVKGRDNLNPYDRLVICNNEKKSCSNGCPGRILVCLGRMLFHVHLSQYGKTDLSYAERELLAPDSGIGGGQNLINHNIRNHIFIYELNQMSDDDMWDVLANILKVPYIPHDIHMGDNTERMKKKHKSQRVDFCDAKYDDFRSVFLLHGYNMSQWFCNYIVPVAKDESRNDLTIANPDHFCELVKTYGEDPCHRLVRMDNGTYVLGHQLVVAQEGNVTTTDHDRD